MIAELQDTSALVGLNHLGWSYSTSTIMAAAPYSMQQPSESVVPQSHVGFDSITSQIERKLLKRGFQFNVICVGMGSLLSKSSIALLIIHLQVKRDWANPPS